MHVSSALHLEETKEEASVGALKLERSSEATLRKREREGMSLGTGGGTGEGSQQAAPEGITRRLLIRTRANEVQGRPAHTSAAGVSLHG